MLAAATGRSGPNSAAHAVQRGDQRLYALDEQPNGSVGNARPVDFDVERSSRHGRFYGNLDDGTVRLHAKLFEYRCHVGIELPNAAHSPHHDRGRHRHANSYRRVRSEWPGQRYERWEPSALSGVYINCHHHRRNQRRIFEHHAAIRGWCAGSFRIAVDPRRGWQPDHGRDSPRARRRAPQPPS